MCNLSDLIEEKGIKEGKLMLLVSLLDSGKLTLAEAAEEMQIPVTELEEVLEEFKQPV